MDGLVVLVFEEASLTFFGRLSLIERSFIRSKVKFSTSLVMPPYFFVLFGWSVVGLFHLEPGTRSEHQIFFW